MKAGVVSTARRSASSFADWLSSTGSPAGIDRHPTVLENVTSDPPSEPELTLRQTAEICRDEISAGERSLLPLPEMAEQVVGSGPHRCEKKVSVLDVSTFNASPLLRKLQLPVP